MFFKQLNYISQLIKSQIREKSAINLSVRINSLGGFNYIQSQESYQLIIESINPQNIPKKQPQVTFILDTVSIILEKSNVDSSSMMSIVIQKGTQLCFGQFRLFFLKMNSNGYIRRELPLSTVNQPLIERGAYMIPYLFNISIILLIAQEKHERRQREKKYQDSFIVGMAQRMKLRWAILILIH
ncbi:unnamed protein product [Paramecium octaurelia]|uniref:Uncharacterized protein n=1 Tax=Paramecium octaurelia TaxID=43137 RepID=A0A8S1YBR7_PAROT|nr:unnamed protein product [Paramecium octaurelia]